VIAGLGFAIGYGVGVLVSWLLRLVRVPEPSARWKRRAWTVLRWLGPILVVFWLLIGVGWQNEVRTLVGEDDEGLTVAVQVAVVAVPVAVVAILFGRLLRLFNGWIVRHLRRFIPPVRRGDRRRHRHRRRDLPRNHRRALQRVRRRHEQHLREHQREHQARRGAAAES